MRFARSPADGPHPALCAAGRGRMFFLFFQEKKRKNQRKETLTGGICAQTLGQPSPGLRASGGGGCSFFSFGKRKERTKEKKPYRGGGCAQAGGRAAPGIRQLFFPAGLFKEKPRKIFLRGRQAPLTGGRGGPTQAGSRLSFLVLFSFSGKKREQIFPAGLFFQKSPAKYFLRGRQAPLTGGRDGPTQAGS